MQVPDPMAIFSAQVANSVHPIPPASAEPDEVMLNWRLYQVRSQDGARHRHLVGRIQGMGEGRATTALVRVDLTTSMAETSSGRQYFLEGESDYDSEAAYIWARWLRINRPTEVRDVSRALAKLLARAARQGQPASQNQNFEGEAR